MSSITTLPKWKLFLGRGKVFLSLKKLKTRHSCNSSCTNQRIGNLVLEEITQEKTSTIGTVHTKARVDCVHEQITTSKE